MVQVAETRVALGTGEAAKILVSRLSTLPEAKAGLPEALLVALAGQPNAGKSTVFNILTGLSQHVGNWPGKTVEKKEGAHSAEGRELRIVDLPGTYSLTAFSEEERVARDFIIHEAPDVIVLLVNAAVLERSLYLLSELVLLGPPIVVAVNMLDVAETTGHPDRYRRPGEIPRHPRRPDGRHEKPGHPGTRGANHRRFPRESCSTGQNCLRCGRTIAELFDGADGADPGGGAFPRTPSPGSSPS